MLYEVITSNEGIFEIDTQLYTKEKLVTNIEKLGYKVEDSLEELEKEQLKEFSKLKKIFKTALSFTIAIFIIMFFKVFEELVRDYIILALATIVQFYCGARFYTVITSYSIHYTKLYDRKKIFS